MPADAVLCQTLQQCHLQDFPSFSPFFVLLGHGRIHSTAPTGLLFSQSLLVRMRRASVEIFTLSLRTDSPGPLRLNVKSLTMQQNQIVWSALVEKLYEVKGAFCPEGVVIPSSSDSAPSSQLSSGSSASDAGAGVGTTFSTGLGSGGFSPTLFTWFSSSVTRDKVFWRSCSRFDDFFSSASCCFAWHRASSSAILFSKSRFFFFSTSTMSAATCPFVVGVCAEGKTGNTVNLNYITTPFNYIYIPYI